MPTDMTEERLAAIEKRLGAYSSTASSREFGDLCAALREARRERDDYLLRLEVVREVLEEAKANPEQAAQIAADHARVMAMTLEKRDD